MFKVFGSELIRSSDSQNYLMNQSVIVCTSSTRPSTGGAPLEGMVIYETDTDKLLIYTTATTLWQPPWNMPWGSVARVTSSTLSQTGITTETDVTGMTVTWTAVANRIYKTTFQVEVGANSVATNDVGSLILTDGSNNHKQRVLSTGTGQTTYSSVGGWCTGTLYETGLSSGSTTRKLRLARNAGTTATFSTFSNGTDAMAILLVEDVGPSAAPA
jgi:hypothetical protein